MAKDEHELPQRFSRIHKPFVLPDLGSVKVAIKKLFFCEECGWTETPPKPEPFQSGDPSVGQMFGTSYRCGECGKEIGRRITGGSHSPKR